VAHLKRNEVKLLKNSKSEILINALLIEPTIRNVAVSTKISESTIYEYLRKEDFVAELNRRRSELVSETKNFLLSRLREATETIFEIMNDRNAPSQTRLNASEAAFRNTLKLIETSEILSRLDALEATTDADSRIKSDI